MQYFTNGGGDGEFNNVEVMNIEKVETMDVTRDDEDNPPNVDDTKIVQGNIIMKNQLKVQNPRHRLP